jgi:Meckel syndrome type 1 protein
MSQKMTGGSTRFDVQLNPAGLGRVDVAVSIDAKGLMSAALTFEKPEAASLMGERSAELQKSLADAGFTLSASSMSFTTHASMSASASTAISAAGDALQSGLQGGFQGGFQGGSSDNGFSSGRASFGAGRAFGAASMAADQADQSALSSQSLRARGLDIRI